MHRRPVCGAGVSRQTVVQTACEYDTCVCQTVSMQWAIWQLLPSLMPIQCPAAAQCPGSPRQGVAMVVAGVVAEVVWRTVHAMVY